MILKCFIYHCGFVGFFYNCICEFESIRLTSVPFNVSSFLNLCLWRGDTSLLDHVDFGFKPLKFLFLPLLELNCLITYVIIVCIDDFFKLTLVDAHQKHY